MNNFPAVYIEKFWNRLGFIINDIPFEMRQNIECLGLGQKLNNKKKDKSFISNNLLKTYIFKMGIWTYIYEHHFKNYGITLEIIFTNSIPIHSSNW